MIKDTGIKHQKHNKLDKRPRKLQPRIILSLLLLFTGINVLSWNSKAFTDWYRLAIFPIWTGTLGRLSGLFAGSVGEILIIIGIVLVLAQLLLLPVFVWACIKKVREKGVLHRLLSWDLRLVCWVLVYIYGTETLNCYVMYHASTVEGQYFETKSSYGTEELVRAYSIVVAQANRLAGQVARDEKGQAVYSGTQAGLYQACKQAMRAQGQAYPYLDGYYPDPKPIRASHFMSQQHLLGIYFPFTMEANYNTVMYPLNVPATICHEFSHLKGIILEDEANFFGFVACIESDDVYLQYSGYLSVLGYLARQVRESVPKEIRSKLENAQEQVVKDDVFLTQEAWGQVEGKAIVPTEMVNEATHVFLEKNLTLNGVQDGIQSYSRVVRLVIDYYESQ